MNILNSNIFKQKIEKPSLLEIVLWWEFRRIFYNFLLFLLSIFTMIFCIFVEYQSCSTKEYIDSFFPDSPLFGFITMAIIANVFYTGGEIAEIFLRKILGSKANHYGEIFFKAGLLFSLIMLIMPSLYCLIALIFKC